MSLYRILGTALVVVVGTGVTLSLLHPKTAPRNGLCPAVSVAAVPAIVRSLRPTYPYSIIPGGAYNRAELQTQLRRDPVARQHYADFDTDNTRLVSTEQDRSLYVSYRQHGQVFWTKKKLRIPKGELLLSDGQHLARTRCGNRLAAQKPTDAKTSQNEPSADLVMPTVSDANLPSLNDQRITFSSPPPVTAVLDASVAPPLDWQPKDLPFEWVPTTKNLSASPTGFPGGLSNLVGGPFLFPTTRTASSTGSTGGSTTTTTGTKPTSPSGGQPPVVPVVPLTPVPEPAYPAVIAAVLALLGVHLWSRTRHAPASRVRIIRR